MNPATPEPGALDLESRPPINNRYRIARCLGRGGMGMVYLVSDLRDANRPLALKCIRSDKIDARTLAILRNEFLALSALPHPNLARVFEFGIDRITQDYFFTSELVDGVDWLKACQALNLSLRPQLEDFLDVLAQVLRALEFIHTRGMVHGDMKPENVLVRREVVRKGAGTGTALLAKIIDFGLAKKEKAHGGKKILGTPLYVAPETILGAAIDRRADLYSLGVLLYHVATGAPPFRGSTNLAILKGHVEETAKPPHEIDPRIPVALSGLILRLMEKKPQDRPEGALEVIEALNGAFNTSLPLETPETRSSYLDAALLAGREREVSRLRAIFLSASGKAPADVEVVDDVHLALHGEDGHPALDVEEEPAPPGRLVLIRGEKGLGKRRIAAELKVFAQSQGAQHATFDCAATDGRAGLARLAAMLGVHLELEPGDWSRIAVLETPPPELPRRRGRVDPGAPDPLRTRLREAAHAIIRSTRKHALVLHFQDLHAASDDVLALVKEIVEISAREKPEENRLLLTATALDRSDVERTPFQALADTVLLREGALHLEVERLDEGGVSRLIASAFTGDPLPPDLAQRVLEESDGNLETAVQILRFLLDRGKITRTPRGWVLSPDHEGEDVPGRVRRDLKERLGMLPNDAYLLARAVSCLGDPCRPELAARLAGLAPRAAVKALDVLRREKILAVRVLEAEADSCSFVHSSARNILYHSIPAADLEAMHEKAGALSEEEGRAAGKEDTKKLARHYLRSGNKLKGIQYGLEAGRQFASELRPPDAIQAYEQVLRLAGADDAKLVRKVSQEIASLRFLVGDYKGAVDALGPLPDPRGVKGDGRWEMTAFLLAARARARLGHFDESRGLLDGALSLSKRLHAASEAQALLALAELHLLKGSFVESLRLCARTLASQGESKDPTFLCELYMIFAESHAALNDRDRAASHTQLALRILDAQHDTKHLAWSLFCRGRLYLYKSQLLKAAKQFHLALILRRKMGAFDGQADCLLELGSIQHSLGSPEEARPLLEEALAHYEKSGNLSRRVAALTLLGEVLRLTGDYPECRRAVGESLRRQGLLESRRIHVQTLLTFAGLCMDKGDLSKSERYLRDAEDEEAHGSGTTEATVSALSLLSDQALQGGRLGDALECATQGVAAAREVGDPSLLAALQAQQAFLFSHLGRTGDARRVFVSVLDIARRHELPSCEGKARLLEAVVLTAEGKLDGAQKLFGEALGIYAAHASERDLARLYLEQGLLHLRRGQLEEAYLGFEEGLALARKLHLSWLQARFHVAIGLLEMALSPGESPRAEEEFLEANAFATKSPYPEILWQTHFHLGRLLLRTGKDEEAGARLRDAFGELKKVLGGIPETYREPYLALSGAEELAILLQKALRKGVTGRTA